MSNAKKIAALRKSLIKQINDKVGKNIVGIRDENIMAQFIDQYQFELILTVAKNKVEVEDAEGDTSELTFDDLTVEVLDNLIGALGLKK